MVNYSWNELRLAYENIIKLGKDSAFRTNQYEDLGDEREYHCVVKYFWGTRRTEKGYPTAGTLRIIPHDDQWTKGYAFAIVDGRKIVVKNGCPERYFVRQMPSRAGYEPTEHSDKKGVERSRGGRQFPTCALLFNYANTGVSAKYRKMATGEVSEDPYSEDMWAMYRTGEQTEMLGTDGGGSARHVCSFDDIDEEQRLRYCGVCGMPEGDDLANVAPEVQIQGRSGGGAKGLAFITPLDFRTEHSKLIGLLEGCLDKDMLNEIKNLYSTKEWEETWMQINQRKDSGEMNSQGNAWIVWNKLNSRQKPLWRDAHFVIATWVWCKMVGGLLDNELLRNVHMCFLAAAKADEWTPRDILMVVEILRLMWWEKVGGDFEWTPLPANIVP